MAVMPRAPAFTLLLLGLLTLLAGPGRVGAAEPTRATVAQLLVFGRAADLAVAAKRDTSLADLLGEQRATLQHDRAARERAARAAWFDAFGRAATNMELASEVAVALTYTERMQRHVARLAAQRADYEAVIQRAYRWVVHRDAYAEEFAYWQPHGVLPFVALVACLEDWARRNQPGLMATAGTPTLPLRSERLTIMALPPELAAEVRAIILPGEPDARALIVGGGKLATPAGMRLAVFGRD